MESLKRILKSYVSADPGPYDVGQGLYLNEAGRSGIEIMNKAIGHQSVQDLATLMAVHQADSHPNPILRAAFSADPSGFASLVYTIMVTAVGIAAKEEIR